MTRRTAVRGLGCAGVLAVLTACFALLWAGAPTAGAATAPWAPMSTPWGTSWFANDISAFTSSGLAAAGDDGHIAITRNGGHTWSTVVPKGLGQAVLTAIAVDSSGRGVVASGGLLRVLSGWTSTWTAPTYPGPGPWATIYDVALRGSRAVAVGGGGMIMSSVDMSTDGSSPTWQQVASPTSSTITCVAIAGDGTAVAGSQAGEILVGTLDGTGEYTWSVAANVGAAVTAVAASATTPTLGDGLPDLFAATGHDVFGSDDEATFASLAGLPDLNSQSWPLMAWLGMPTPSLALAGGHNAGLFEPTTQLWQSGSTGLTGTARAAAPGGQSVAYVLGTDGRLMRTMSAGGTPATVRLSRSTVSIGAKSRLTATVHVGAPGAVRLRYRVPGRSWKTVKTTTWKSADWDRTLAYTLRPTLTHEYRLQFKYGGAYVTLAPTAKVVVKPKISTSTSRLYLRVGAVYRLTGSVRPTLPGGKVAIYTDRGGKWRPVSHGGWAKLKNGRTWASRRFGTPKAETYHLRARMPATRTHGSSWSRVVTVAIHR
jgi:hypothetical protein